MSRKLSIIVPVYNVEKYLRQCLESLVRQTVENYEVIVVNDGSPDNSQAIIDEFAAGYPDIIRPLVKENGGLSDARNYGLARAEGEYIAFVDSDDFVSPEMFGDLLRRAEEKDADVVACMFMSVWDDGRYDYNQSPKGYTWGQSIKECPQQLILVKSYAWNKIYRRELFERSGLLFPVGQCFEDSAMVYNLLSYANRIEYVPVPYYFYRRERPGAITTLKNENIFDIFRSCDSLRTFYEGLDGYDEIYRDTISQLIFGHITFRYYALIGSKDKKLALRYIKTAFEYLDTHFPGWKKQQKKLVAGLSREKRLSRFLKRHRSLISLLVLLPFKSSESVRAIKNKVKDFAAVLRKKKADSTADQKAAALSAVGYDLIARAKETADRSGVVLFADFGTLLGFVRDGGFMSHDIDLDMGVILGDVPHQVFHDALIADGFKLWRNYYMGSRIVEDSYYYDLNGHRIKCDFNYYEVTPEYSRTWLFYRDPDIVYGRATRNIVEMTYSPITGTKTLEVDGHPIPVPAEPEQLLREKYGEGWTTKDTGWIYWKSPAAVPIEGIGYYYTSR